MKQMRGAQSSRHFPVYVAAIMVAVLLVVASSLYVAKQQAHLSGHNDLVSDAITTPVPSASGKVLGLASSETAPASLASPSPTAAVSAKNTDGSLPDSARATVANFYAAYKIKDAARLGQLFTADSTDSQIHLHALLFSGKDEQGNVTDAGPTLFVSNNVLLYATSYTILGAAPENKNWIITLSEKRRSVSTDDTTVITLMTLVPVSDGQGTWAIDKYVHTGGATAKYDAFFTE